MLNQRHVCVLYTRVIFKFRGIESHSIVELSLLTLHIKVFSHFYFFLEKYLSQYFFTMIFFYCLSSLLPRL